MGLWRFKRENHVFSQATTEKTLKDQSRRGRGLIQRCWMQSRGCGVEELALGGHGAFFFFYNFAKSTVVPGQKKKKKSPNHLTACNGATPETIFPFPFFVNGGPETAPVLGGEEEWSTESEAEKGKGGFPFFPFLSLIFFFFLLFG